jgi:CheY-like chemotaxis protein
LEAEIEVASERVDRKRVLIVDDDRLLAETLRVMIGDRAEVQVITNGPQAAALLEGGAHFDAVICDLGMPGVDGIALYERLRLRGSPLAGRFLLVTGGAFTDSASSFLERAPIPYLEKPFDSQQLGTVLAPFLAD